MKSIFFNIIKAFFITLIVVTLTALIFNIIFTPDFLDSAVFGGF